MFKFISYQKEYTCFKVTLTKIAKIRALKYDSNNKIIFYRHFSLFKKQFNQHTYVNNIKTLCQISG